MVKKPEQMFQLFDQELQTSHPLTGLIKEIGRSEECDIPLPKDESVSRVHARLDRDGENWVLVDLDSTNGTYLNGERIRESKLKNGDVIEIGDTKLRFMPLKSADAVARKKTTQISSRRESPEPTRPEVKGGPFQSIKTIMKKK